MHPRFSCFHYMSSICWRIFAKLLSLVNLGTQMTWLRFWVKRSKFKVTASRRRRTALDATIECNFSSLYCYSSQRNAWMRLVKSCHVAYTERNYSLTLTGQCFMALNDFALSSGPTPGSIFQVLTMLLHLMSYIGTATPITGSLLEQPHTLVCGCCCFTAVIFFSFPPA